MTSSPTQAATERLRAYLAEFKTFKGLHPEEIHAFNHAVLRASDLSLLLQLVEAQEQIRRIVEVYFMPWGAAKAAMWEDLCGDNAFSADVAMKTIAKILSSLPKPGGGE